MVGSPIKIAMANSPKIGEAGSEGREAVLNDALAESELPSSNLHSGWSR